MEGRRRRERMKGRKEGEEWGGKPTRQRHEDKSLFCGIRRETKSESFYSEEKDKEQKQR